MIEISPLHRRMIDDMTIRNLSPATQRSYLHAANEVLALCRRSPDRLGLEDVRAFRCIWSHRACRGRLEPDGLGPCGSSLASRLVMPRYRSALPTPGHPQTCRRFSAATRSCGFWKRLRA